MLSIKLSRKGKKNQPFFRMILLENRKDPWGNFLEDLGFVNPLTKKMSLKEERIKYWISKGAQPSGTVHNLLVNQGIIKGEKVKVTRLSNRRRQLAEKEKEKGKEKAPAQKLAATETSKIPAAAEQSASEVPKEEKAKEEKRE